jgi:hypothetical protein
MIVCRWYSKEYIKALCPKNTIGQSAYLFFESTKKGGNMKKRYKKIIELIKSVMPVGIVFAISIIFYMLTNSIIEGVSFIFLMISIVTGLYFIVYILFIMITLLPYLASGIIGKIIGKFSRKRIVLDKSDFEKNKQYLYIFFDFFAVILLYKLFRGALQYGYSKIHSQP